MKPQYVSFLSFDVKLNVQAALYIRHDASSFKVKGLVNKWTGQFSCMFCLID